MAIVQGVTRMYRSIKAGVLNMLRFFMTVVMLAVGAGQALAATVEVSQPQVLVEDVPISGAVAANPGARVTAGPSGSAMIYYENGCSEVVGPNETRIVQSNPVCRGFFLENKGVIIGGVVVFGGIAAIIASGNGDDGPASTLSRHLPCLPSRQTSRGSPCRRSRAGTAIEFRRSSSTSDPSP